MEHNMDSKENTELREAEEINDNSVSDEVAEDLLDDRSIFFGEESV
jgi:hypothetical protein